MGSLFAPWSQPLRPKEPCEWDPKWRSARPKSNTMVALEVGHKDVEDVARTTNLQIGKMTFPKKWWFPSSESPFPCGFLYFQGLLLLVSEGG